MHKGRIAFVILCLFGGVASAFAFTIFRGWQTYEREGKRVEDLERAIWPVTSVKRDAPVRLAYAGKPSILLMPGPLFDQFAPGLYYNSPEVRYWLNPGFEIVSDRSGFRVGSPRVAVSTIDILAVGGSHVWGQGLDYSELFSSLVAERLDYTLGNAGVPGYGGVQSLLQLEQYLDFQPRLILFGLFEDLMYRDIEPQDHHARPLLARHGDQYAIRRGGLWTLGERAVPDILKSFGIGGVAADAYFVQLRRDFAKITGKLGLSSAFVQRYNYGGRPEYGDTEMLPLMIAGMSYILGRMNEHARALKARFVAVYLPTIRNGRVNDVPRDWVNLAREQGFVLIDTTSFIRSFLERGEAAKILVPKDDHYNETVNAYIAAQIIENFEE